MRPCNPGEVLTPTKACNVCSKNMYTLEAGADKWEDCPIEADCIGGMNIFPRENYWRSGKYSDEFYRCRLLDVCLGGEEA